MKAFKVRETSNGSRLHVVAFTAYEARQYATGIFAKHYGCEEEDLDVQCDTLQDQDYYLGIAEYKTRHQVPCTFGVPQCAMCGKAPAMAHETLCNECSIRAASDHKIGIHRAWQFEDESYE